MNDRQLGIIKITEDTIRKDLSNVAKMLALMSFVPVRVENKFNYNNIVEMMGISSYFEQIELGAKIPEYIISIHEDEDRNISIHSIDMVDNKSIDGVLRSINKDLDKDK